MSVTVSQLISGIKALPDDTKRKMSAIIGAVVADAASLPLQWIYDDKEILSDKFEIHMRLCSRVELDRENIPKQIFTVFEK